MPVKKQKVRGKKATTYRPKRRYGGRLKMFTRSVPRSIRSNLYHYKRRYDQFGTGNALASASNLMPNVIAVNAGATLAVGIQFLFSFVQNYTEFTNLYDQFRINKVVIKLQLRHSPDTATFYDSNYPNMLYASDHDDSSTIANSSLIQFGNCKRRILRPNKYETITVVPSILTTNYGPITSNYVPKFKQWVDSSNAGTPHYGLHLNITNNSNTQEYYVDLDYIFYFSCKNPN